MSLIRQLKGNIMDAATLRGYADVQMNILKNSMQFSGLNQNVRNVLLNDGTSISCSSNFGLDKIIINKPQPVVPVKIKFEPIKMEFPYHTKELWIVFYLNGEIEFLDENFVKVGSEEKRGYKDLTKLIGGCFKLKTASSIAEGLYLITAYNSKIFIYDVVSKKVLFYTSFLSFMSVDLVVSRLYIRSDIETSTGWLDFYFDENTRTIDFTYTNQTDSYPGPSVVTHPGQVEHYVYPAPWGSVWVEREYWKYVNLLKGEYYCHDNDYTYVWEYGWLPNPHPPPDPMFTSTGFRVWQKQIITRSYTNPGYFYSYCTFTHDVYNYYDYYGTGDQYTGHKTNTTLAGFYDYIKGVYYPGYYCKPTFYPSGYVCDLWEIPSSYANYSTTDPTQVYYDYYAPPGYFFGYDPFTLSTISYSGLYSDFEIVSDIQDVPYQADELTPFYWVRRKGVDVITYKGETVTDDMFGQMFHTNKESVSTIGYIPRTVFNPYIETWDTYDDVDTIELEIGQIAEVNEDGSNDLSEPE